MLKASQPWSSGWGKESWGEGKKRKKILEVVPVEDIAFASIIRAPQWGTGLFVRNRGDHNLNRGNPGGSKKPSPPHSSQESNSERIEGQFFKMGELGRKRAEGCHFRLGSAGEGRANRFLLKKSRCRKKSSTQLWQAEGGKGVSGGLWGPE